MCLGSVLLPTRGAAARWKAICRGVRLPVRRRSSRTSGKDDAKGAILRHTRVSRDHLTPEIGLHLLTPDCPLYNAPVTTEKGHDALDPAFRDPFWSIYWPGGQGLARYILDRGRDLFPKGSSRVLDLGAGCGAAGIAAKLSGADQVLANDIDPVAGVAVGMNAALNGVELGFCGRNLIAESYDHDFDVIFAGDLLYDEEISGILVPWLERASKLGARIYLGDPGRHGLTGTLKKRLTKLRTYPLPENVRRENHGFDSSTVWEFAKH